MPCDDDGKHWRASLALRFACDHGATLLVHRAHQGPLVVQKTLQPEGREVCQAVIVHPPGGIAGGDTLALSVDILPNAHSQLITPGATKWYRSAGSEALQTFDASVAAGGVLEWLPHEAIVFDAARVRTRSRLTLAATAIAIVWDIVCLGRIAHGERFTRGSVHQRFEVVRDDALVWVEQTVIDRSTPVCGAHVGLDDRPVYGTLLVTAPLIKDQWIAAARAIGSDLADADCAVTRIPGALIARCRAATTPPIHAWFRAVWSRLRPEILGRDAVMPRLWTT